ncbi:hypothetical protein [Clostridium cochlearium]|uniref:Uncharacterized protein n=1 Tax=Clostridium cochlearium TaxID=1494 RepID=A0A240A6Q9_CLOCO|nr:hypothetical protein [Clostridium cochlearium]MCR1970467.1 hypothetical protein [Clostridium cochlearium]MDU1443928.1 hypothetical protein [Clostridium cochlearium]SDL25788.1 hypothetical protein SAMN05216497_11457 [Clostridium cochlearium]SNV79017.1 Uncharacterised protein [Clostridium cochlearium]SQB32996.1 Uncharacterised protein [Clostridium cochlearium]
MGRGTRKKNKDRTDFSHLMINSDEENNNDNEINTVDEKKEDE